MLCTSCCTCIRSAGIVHLSRSCDTCLIFFGLPETAYRFWRHHSWCPAGVQRENPVGQVCVVCGSSGQWAACWARGPHDPHRGHDWSCPQSGPVNLLGLHNRPVQALPESQGQEGLCHCRQVVALCCAVLCCAVLCCAVLCCAVLCCAVLCCAVLCCAVLCCAVLCCAVLCCAVLYEGKEPCSCSLKSNQRSSELCASC